MTPTETSPTLPAPSALFDSPTSPLTQSRVATLTDPTNTSPTAPSPVTELLSRLTKTLRKDPRHRKTNGAFGGRARVNRQINP